LDIGILLWAYYKRTSTNNNTKRSQPHFIHTSFTLFHCYIEAEVNACGRWSSLYVCVIYNRQQQA